jgi:hypothetical protein
VEEFELVASGWGWGDQWTAFVSTVMNMFHIPCLTYVYKYMCILALTTLKMATCVGKVKVIPQQAEVAQGVPCRLRPRIFLTFGTRSSAIRTGRLYPSRKPWYSFSGAESTPWFRRREPRKKSPVTPPGIDPRTVRLVAQCLNRYATSGPHVSVVNVL